jgi:hypothetical protein
LSGKPINRRAAQNAESGRKDGFSAFFAVLFPDIVSRREDSFDCGGKRSATPLWDHQQAWAKRRGAALPAAVQNALVATPPRYVFAIISNRIVTVETFAVESPARDEKKVGPADALASRALSTGRYAKKFTA